LKIVGFVGMPGSGKSVASDVARSIELEVVVMGDIIRNEAERLCLAPTDENLGKVGNMLRAHEGPAAVAKRTLEQAKRSGKYVVVIDGLRSRDEVEFFRAYSDYFRLVEVRASPEARLKRIADRRRSDDANFSHKTMKGSMIVPSCEDTLQETAKILENRECRELGWGMCEAFKEADIIIDNDGRIEEFRAKVLAFLKEMENRSN
jgi:dephospho-CoA kinase